MWTTKKNISGMGFLTPPPPRRSKRLSPLMPRSEKKRTSPQPEADLFHVIHKVPAGDSPYVRAKHVQLVDKDPSRAISMFWAAINSGDRVDSALKDMAVVMKQLNRAEEAIEAIKSFRHLCPLESQASLDNLLVELYKRSGRIEEQIEMLQVKLKHIEEGIAFGGKRTKTGRSQGKKIQITIEQEYSRVLGNLAWAYLQQDNYKLAEELYRKALSLEQDKNKQCNLAICLMHMNKITEARFLLQTIRASSENGPMDESYAKSFERAMQMLADLDSGQALKPIAWEEESQKETRTPFSSLISSNSNHHENKNSANLSGSDDGSSKCTSFGQRNCSQTWIPEKLKRSYTGNSYERKAELTSKNVYPPVLGPFTQPRRCPWAFNNGVQRREWVEEDANTGCNRKLSFEQPKNEKICCPSSSGDWRKAQLGDYDSVNNKCVLQTRVNGAWKKNYWENKRLEKVASNEFKLPMEPPVTVDSVRMTEVFCDGDCDRRCNITIEDISENLNVTHEPLGQGKPVRDLFGCGGKKSWADMVEEDEQKLLSGSSFYENKEEFDDENMNCNIFHGTPRPLNQIEMLNQKIESSLGLKDGYYTQPKNATSTMNRGVQRSLCFDQHDKPDRDENNCSSPLLEKALNFEAYKSPLGDNYGSGIKLMKRNRLQVFRDITLDPESPRP